MTTATAVTVTAVAVFQLALVESGHFTRIGGWWDRNGENEIDLVAADEEGKTATFFEVKRSSDRYSPALLERKRDAFLKATGKFRGWRLSCAPLGMPRVEP